MSPLPLIFGAEAEASVGVLSATKTTFAAAQATGVQNSIADLEFDPVLAFLFGNSAVAPDTSGDALRWFFGAVAAAGQAVIMGASDDAAATMNTGRGYKTDAGIWLPASGTPTDDAVASVELVAAGVDSDYSDAAAAAAVIHGLILGGDAWEEAVIVPFAASTLPGDQDIPVGFSDAGCVLFFTVGGTTPGGATVQLPTMGAATSDEEQWTWTAIDRDGISDSECISDLRTDACITRVLTTGLQDGLASYVGPVGDNIRINWSDAPATAITIFAVVMKGPRFKVGTYVQAASAMTTEYPDLDFPFEALLVAGNGRTSTSISTTAPFEVCIGAAAGVEEQGHIAGRSEDAAPTSDVHQVTDTDKLFGAITSAGAQRTQEVTALDPLTIETVNTNAAVICPFIGLAASQEAEGGGGRRSASLALLGVG